MPTDCCQRKARAKAGSKRRKDGGAEGSGELSLVGQHRAWAPSWGAAVAPRDDFRQRRKPPAAGPCRVGSALSRPPGRSALSSESPNQWRWFFSNSPPPSASLSVLSCQCCYPSPSLLSPSSLALVVRELHGVLGGGWLGLSLADNREKLIPLPIKFLFYRLLVGVHRCSSVVKKAFF